MEYIGEIRMFAGTFPPRNWAFCDGQVMDSASNEALYSLIGNIYGGTPDTSFALPDLRGRIAMHSGSAPGLTPVRQGERIGQETVTLLTANLPPHTHTASGTMLAAEVPGKERKPGGNSLAGSASDTQYANQTATTPMSANSVNVTVGNTGGGLSVDIRNLHLGIQYIICLFGQFPSRS